MPQYAPIWELSSLNGANGFRMAGVAAGDWSGFFIGAAGDLNGDGFDDLAVGSYLASPTTSLAGAAYVVYGAAGGFGANLNLSSLNGTNGFRMTGANAGDNFGVWVTSAGDLNDDGIDDLVVGAWLADPNGADSGAAYVVFGTTSGFPATLSASTLTGANGFRLSGGAANANAGFSASAAGDVNGDGVDDLIIGANQWQVATGTSYVVFGSASGFAADLNLSTLNGSNGFSLSGSGWTVSGGDINGDGFSDLIVGAPLHATNGANSGATYVVFGASGGFAANLNLSTLNGANGFRISGEAANNRSGYSASAAGDVNGDGFEDIIIGAPIALGGSGAAYVVFGAASGFGANLNLSTLNGVNGFRITGAAAGDQAGYQVHAAGDFNGDGFDDLIVGAWAADPNGGSSGAAFLVFGAAGGFAATLSLASLDGNNGIRLNGVSAGDSAGLAVSRAGDVNGDGFDDIMVGAPTAVGNTGYTYVVFGSAPGEAVTRAGTATANTIHGGALNDTLSGFAGGDTLIGNAGADMLDGGAGVDTSVYSIASTSASWMRSPDGAWTVSAGADGTDTVTSVEFLDFTDRDVFLDRPQSNFSTDGVSDFFLRNSSTGAMVMWFNASGGNAASLGSLGTNWISEGIGDFNGDGRDDILWRDSNNGNMSMWFMNNNAVIGSGGFGVGLSWNISGVGDVNGDGRDDIIWRNNNGDLVLWFMNGTSISAAGLGNVSTAWQIEVVGDFNGDGRDDFIWRNGTTGDMSMWLMNGTAVTPNNFANVGGNWNIVGVGDLSGDGRDDVIWRDQTTGNTSLWFMNGGTIVSQSGFNVANNYSIADVGDYNGDGRDDIIWRNSATNDVLAWFMNGATVTGSTFVGGLGSDWIINPGG